MVGPGGGGATLAAPSKRGGSSMCSVAMAKITLGPTLFTSLTQVASSPSLETVLPSLSFPLFDFFELTLLFDDIGVLAVCELFGWLPGGSSILSVFMLVLE